MNIDQLEKETFEIVDDFLKSILNKPDSFFSWKSKGQPAYRAFEILKNHNLVTFRAKGSDTSVLDISDNGINVLKIGGIEKYFESINKKSEKKEILENQNLRLQNEKLQNDLIEFPKIKSQRNWLFFIAIVEALAILTGIVLQATTKS